MSNLKKQRKTVEWETLELSSRKLEENCCSQYVSRFQTLSSGQRTGKGQFSFQSQRRAISKNVQTTIQLYEVTEWVKIGKGVQHGCVLSPCLFNLYAEYIKQNARLDELQAGMKTSGRNINNLRYAYDTTLIAKSEEEQNSLLMRVIEESQKTDLKLNLKKPKIMASDPITSWQTERGKVEAVTYIIFLGSKITADGDCSQEIKKHQLL